MTFTPLQNYLRTHRRRNHLSQDEVAFLMGVATGSRVTRHEGSDRIPTLQVALGYELLFGVPMRELFTGEVHKVESIIRERLPELIRRTKEESPENLQKLSFLQGLAGRLASQNEKHSRSEDVSA